MILIDRNEKKMEEKKNQNECYEKQVDWYLDDNIVECK
jgi:hypothetical protein